MRLRRCGARRGAPRRSKLVAARLPQLQPSTARRCVQLRLRFDNKLESCCWTAGAHSRRTRIHGIACSGGHLSRALLPTIVSYRGAAAHPVAAVSGRTQGERAL